MTLFFYRTLLALASPLILYQSWKRCKKDKTQSALNTARHPIPHCFKHRLGLNPTPFNPHGILIHAASIGESRSIFPLLEALHKQHPELPITITNSSIQGYHHVTEFAPVPVQQHLLPLDYGFALNHFLTKLQPKIVIMVETEIWPTLYRTCHKAGIPLLLINARLKERSFKNYQKWGGKLIQKSLNQTQLVAPQYQQDADRFLKLGLDETKCRVLGNLKSDFTIDSTLPNQADQWRVINNAQQRPIWVAGSTHKDPKEGKSEEARLLEAHQQLLKTHPSALLILVPRHETRFTDVEGIIQQSGLKWQKRTDGDTVHENCQVYLGDTFGELLLWYAIADICFVGGSMVEFGGHNLLEAASLKKPILSGQHIANLAAMFSSFIHANAIHIVKNPAQLNEVLNALIKDRSLASDSAQKAYACFEQQQGALDKTLQAIKPYLVDDLGNSK